jgi:hypothetical protein
MNRMKAHGLFNRMSWQSAAAAQIARAVRNKGRKADLMQRSGSHG